MPRQRMYSENVGGNWGLPPGYMESATAGGRALAAGVSSVGDSISDAINKYKEDDKVREYNKGKFVGYEKDLAKLRENGNIMDPNSEESKVIAKAATFGSMSTQKQIGFLHSVDRMLDRNDKEDARMTQRLDKEQAQANFLLVQKQALDQHTAVNALALKNHELQRQEIMQNRFLSDQARNDALGKLAAKENHDRMVAANISLAYKKAGDLTKNARLFPFFSMKATRENLLPQIAGISDLSPDVMEKILSSVPSQLDIDKATTNRLNAEVQNGYRKLKEIGMADGYGSQNNGPEVKQINGIDFYKDGNGWKPLPKEKADPLADDKDRQKARLNLTITNLEKLKRDGVKSGRVDGDGVVHKPSWLRDDEDLDVLIQRYTKRLSDLGVESWKPPTQAP